MNLPAFGKPPFTEGRQRAILHLQFSLRARFQQGVAGRHLHFMVPEGNNTEGWVRVLGFVAVICCSETYTASWSEGELCIISYLQEVNLMLVNAMSHIPTQLNLKYCMSETTHMESMLPWWVAPFSPAWIRVLKRRQKQATQWQFHWSQEWTKQMQFFFSLPLLWVWECCRWPTQTLAFWKTRHAVGASKSKIIDESQLHSLQISFRK